MATIGYARVSSTGQSLEVQIEKLKTFTCDKIFSEKKSAFHSNRTELNECLNYLREGDMLVITKLDRLARSVCHLSKLSERFNSENIKLVVIDQNIDTRKAVGRLMFNMLAAIAEFENELRRERQLEGIIKAKSKGIKFGRPKKISKSLEEEIYKEKVNGKNIGSIIKKYGISQASVYRIYSKLKKGT